MKVQDSDRNGLIPRGEAWRLLNAVVQDGQPMSELTASKRYNELQPAQRAAAARLCLDTLRYASRADWALKPYLTQKVYPDVQNLLRLAVVEVAVSEAPVHAVINAAVSLAKSNKRTFRAAGMVNAVLRRTMEDRVQNWAKGPVPNLPKWLRKMLLASYGNETMSRIERAHFQKPPLDISVKPGAQVDFGEAAMTLSNGTRRLAQYDQVSALPGFADGDWWVQDAAAAMAVDMIDIAPQTRALDMCAAPGGKTLQLAAKGANVTALDNAEKRLKRVHENLERTGLMAKVICQDALEYKDDPFDLVLVDAPCSATGTIRRHPDLPYVRRDADIKSLVALQKKFLAKAADLTAPGGTLVYCTCSLLPQEGEEQARAFLKSRKDFIATAPRGPWIDKDWKTPEGGIRLRPDYWAKSGGMDGFYICVMKKVKST